MEDGGGQRGDMRYVADGGMQMVIHTLHVPCTRLRQALPKLVNLLPDISSIKLVGRTCRALARIGTSRLA
jgi:hypothetical protein